MSEPRPNTPPAAGVTARMYVVEHAKGASLDRVQLSVAYQGGHNAEWASSTPTGEVKLSLAKGNGASRFFEEALEAGDDIEIVFRRVPRS